MENSEFNPVSNNPIPQTLPNSTAVLVLGICSIVLCFCYGIIGIVCGIIAMVLAKKGGDLYRANPNMYSTSSFKNLRAGRTCALIGLILSGICMLILVMFYGAIFASFPWEEMMNNY